MRVCLKIGDIFEVSIYNREYVYFQFIAKDSCQLFSDVIRVFSGRFKTLPDLSLLMKSRVEFYSHTFLKMGVKSASWRKVGHSDDLGSLDIFFKTSQDWGNHPGQVFVSHNWIVWKVSDNRQYVGTLPQRYYDSDIGLVFPPQDIIYRIENGKYRFNNYPLYNEQHTLM